MILNILNRLAKIGVFLGGFGIFIYSIFCSQLYLRLPFWLANVNTYINSLNFDALYRISLIGPFISGISLFIAALAAFLTFNRRANQHQWDEGFRALYSAFWNDKEFPLLRSWIVSDQLYDAKLRPLLTKRNTTGKFENNLTEPENLLLDKIDRFCAVMVRARSFGTWRTSRSRKRLWKKLLYSDVWTNRNRHELREYIKVQWEELLP
jgi:hypothetical protein